MEKFFLPLVLIIVVISVLTFVTAGDAYLTKRGDQEICVKSKSCAINYMNKLNKEDE